jgi:Na+/proline symporter
MMPSLDERTAVILGYISFLGLILAFLAIIMGIVTWKKEHKKNLPGILLGVCTIFVFFAVFISTGGSQYACASAKGCGRGFSCTQPYGFQGFVPGLCMVPFDHSLL